MAYNYDIPFHVDLTDRVALVTGGNGGIGGMFCRALAACGATVIVLGRNLERCRMVAVMTPLLIGQQGACVLNVSSMSAFTPLTRIPGYSGAKAGVSNFTQWLATYLARSGVRVNAIAPGFFMTEQNHALQFNPDGTPTPRCAHIVDGTPMRRYGELKELIGAMLFLVDERAASFVTGIVLPVDGGYSAFSGV